jgi:hypothetical protein
MKSREHPPTAGGCRKPEVEDTHRPPGSPRAGSRGHPPTVSVRRGPLIVDTRQRLAHLVLAALAGKQRDRDDACHDFLEVMVESTRTSSRNGRTPIWVSYARPG